MAEKIQAISQVIGAFAAINLNARNCRPLKTWSSFLSLLWSWADYHPSQAHPLTDNTFC